MLDTKGKKQKLIEMNDIAKDLGGVCLSKEYINCKNKLKFECRVKHTFKMTPDKLKNAKHWCPICRGGVKNRNIKDIRKIIKEKDGELLSYDYKNNLTNLKIKCKKQHIWKTRAINILNKNCWCPYCAKTIYDSNYEKKCRESLEWLFNVEFGKARPDWLRFSKKPLELDGYNEHKKIAFEYNGRQHYKSIKFFGGDSELEIRQMRDKYKEDRCKEMGISLVIIPYWVAEREKDELKWWILGRFCN